MNKLKRTPHTSSIFRTKIIPDLETVQAIRARLTILRGQDVQEEVNKMEEVLEAGTQRLENAVIDYLNVLLGAR